MYVIKNKSVYSAKSHCTSCVKIISVLKLVEDQTSLDVLESKLGRQRVCRISWNSCWKDFQNPPNCCPSIGFTKITIYKAS